MKFSQRNYGDSLDDFFFNKNYLYKVVKVTNKGRIEVEKVNSDDEVLGGDDVLRKARERFKNCFKPISSPLAKPNFFFFWWRRKKHIRDLESFGDLKSKRLLLAESLPMSLIKLIESMYDMQRREEKNID
jgi:hypothetical protein